MEESKDLAKLTVNELIGSLQAHEQRISKRVESLTEGAFQARFKGKQPSSCKEVKKQSGYDRNIKTKGGVNEKECEKKGKFPPCGVCKRTNHLEKYCFFKGKPQCRFCSKFGHIERNCRAKNQQQQPQQPRQPQQAHVVEEQQKEDFIFMVALSNCYTSNDSWLLDSGCTYHMTYNQNLFKELDTSCKVVITVGNGNELESTGMGSIAVQTKQGTKLINDVLLVPAIKQNLLSVAQMMKNVYSLHFKGLACTIYDPNDVEIAIVPVKDNFFPINWNHAANFVSTSNADNSWL
ncbi:hypothetical protein CFOL_v3_15389 [Cephalotus follicularis]|uniref:Retrovirus-related Pol polyprotein from transposon TNT 1-94-like beta-barrel domain-containing protein n=1 Tax=Cephalotus follicularis TaxID=3775 RepID=A0A1Q3BVA9_CEPFO|nr:hypothetical protein CFOL_v3_15389 [Cephalotus follicularis]